MQPGHRQQMRQAGGREGVAVDLRDRAAEPGQQGRRDRAARARQHRLDPGGDGFAQPAHRAGCADGRPVRQQRDRSQRGAGAGQAGKEGVALRIAAAGIVRRCRRMQHGAHLHPVPGRQHGRIIGAQPDAQVPRGRGEVLDRPGLVALRPRGADRHRLQGHAPASVGHQVDRRHPADSQRRVARQGRHRRHAPRGELGCQEADRQGKQRGGRRMRDPAAPRQGQQQRRARRQRDPDAQRRLPRQGEIDQDANAEPDREPEHQPVAIGRHAVAQPGLEGRQTGPQRQPPGRTTQRAPQRAPQARTDTGRG